MYLVGNHSPVHIAKVKNYCFLKNYVWTMFRILSKNNGVLPFCHFMFKRNFSLITVRNKPKYLITPKNWNSNVILKDCFKIMSVLKLISNLYFFSLTHLFFKQCFDKWRVTWKNKGTKNIISIWNCWKLLICLKINRVKSYSLSKLSS